MITIRVFILFVVLVLSSVAISACGAAENDETPTIETQAPATVASNVVEPTQSGIDLTSVAARDLAPTAIPTSTISAPTAVPPTSTPVVVDTPTIIPTQVIVPTPTKVPTPTLTPTPYVPTVTPTPLPPTPIPTATPVGFAKFSGTGSMDTTSFISPPNLPWIVEWESEGEGPNSLTVVLMDPASKTEVNTIVEDSGTGGLGGVNLVKGNIGTFYLHVEGPEAGWTVWIQQQ